MTTKVGRGALSVKWSAKKMQARNQEMATSVGGGGSSVSLATRTVDVHAHARGEDSPEKELAANETLREQQQSGVTDFGPPSPRKKMSSRAPMSSPRVQRLEVREQKKASVKCASTLDFTALSVKRPPHTRAPAHDHRLTADDVLEPLRRATGGCFATAKMAASPSEHMAGTAKMIARPREHMARRAWPWLIGQQSRRESARS